MIKEILIAVASAVGFLAVGYAALIVAIMLTA